MIAASGQQYNVGEKHAVMLYVLHNCPVGTSTHVKQYNI